MNSQFKAIAILVGTTIGAGIFGVPYVISKIGFLPGLFYILILGGLILILNLVYSEIVLRTPGDHQFSGYAQIYLGKKTKSLQILSMLSFFISMYGAFLAYLVGISEFCNLLFGGGNSILWGIVFFIFAAIVIHLGLKAISYFGLIFVSFLLCLFVLFFILGAGKIEIANLNTFYPAFLLLPYGVILFALSGNSVIPEMEEVLRQDPQKMKKAVIIGSLIPVFVYILFAFLIVGICGKFTSEDAMSGLLIFLPTWISKLGACIGIFTMASSFLTITYILKEAWFRDLKQSLSMSFSLACLPGLLLFLAGARSFIGILDFSGAVSGGLSGILILIMWKKAKESGKRTPAFNIEIPRFLVILLYIVLILGTMSPFFVF